MNIASLSLINCILNWVLKDVQNDSSHRTEDAPGCREPFCCHSDPPHYLFSFRRPCLKLSNQGDSSILLLSAASNNRIHYSVRVTMTSFPEANVQFSHAFLSLAPHRGGTSQRNLTELSGGSEPGCVLGNRSLLDCTPATAQSFADLVEFRVFSLVK